MTEFNIYANEIYGFEESFSYTKLDNGLVKFDVAKQGNDHKLKFLAYGPSFKIVSSALEESTYINHITGEPFIVTSMFYANIFKTAIIQIEFESEEIQTIEIKSKDLNSINYNLIKIVAKKWIKEVL